jgi:Leucine Rich repeat
VVKVCFSSASRTQQHLRATARDCREPLQDLAGKRLVAESDMILGPATSIDQFRPFAQSLVTLSGLVRVHAVTAPAKPRRLIFKLGPVAPQSVRSADMSAGVQLCVRLRASTKVWARRYWDVAGSTNLVNAEDLAAGQPSKVAAALRRNHPVMLDDVYALEDRLDDTPGHLHPFALAASLAPTDAGCNMLSICADGKGKYAERIAAALPAVPGLDVFRLTVTVDDGASMRAAAAIATSIAQLPAGVRVKIEAHGDILQVPPETPVRDTGAVAALVDQTASHLTSFRLQYRALRVPHLQALMPRLAQCAHLHTLGFAFGGLSVKGVKALVTHMAPCASLRELSLQNSVVNRAGSAAEHVTVLTSLTALDISRNCIGDDGTHSVQQVFSAIAQLPALSRVDAQQPPRNGHRGRWHVPRRPVDAHRA